MTAPYYATGSPDRDSDFGAEAAGAAGKLLSDGSLQHVVLDKTFRMRPLVRNTKTTFTDFLAKAAGARDC